MQQQQFRQVKQQQQAQQEQQARAPAAAGYACSIRVLTALAYLSGRGNMATAAGAVPLEQQRYSAGEGWVLPPSAIV